VSYQCSETPDERPVIEHFGQAKVFRLDGHESRGSALGEFFDLFGEFFDLLGFFTRETESVEFASVFLTSPLSSEAIS